MNLEKGGCISRAARLRLFEMASSYLPENTVRCKVCGSVVGLRTDGTMRNHQGRSGPCPMSNLKP